MKKINKNGHKFIVFLVLISFLPLFVTCGGPSEEASRPQEPSIPPNTYTYTVIYDKNAADATGTMENSAFTIGQGGTLRINNFERNNCIFLGWTITAVNKTVDYTDGQNININLTTAGKTITLYAVWREQYTVIYDKNAVDATGTMENSTFTIGTSETLRINNFERDNCIFLGWTKTSTNKTVDYTDGQSVNNLTTTGKTITLFAVWQETYTVEVTAGSTLQDKFTWITNNVESYTTYIIYVISDNYLNSQNLTYGAKRNVTIHLKGTGNITNNSSSLLFKVNSGITLILDGNITLLSNSGYGMINVSGGFFIMNGGKISGNKYNNTVNVEAGSFTMNGGEISSNGGSSVVSVRGIFTMNGGEISDNMGGGGGVSVSGTFIMNGGKISGNISNNYGGGIFVSGTFIMNGGEISGNTAKSGGGVYFSDGTFTMNNGEIAGNIAIDGSGGGVCVVWVWNNSNRLTFKKIGGTITGSNSLNGNIIKDSLDNIVNNKGRAVFVSYPYNTLINEKRKETTAGTGENLSFSCVSQGVEPTWSGAWDY